MRRLSGILLAVVAVAGGLAWGIGRVVSDRRFEAEEERARRLMAEERFPEARGPLQELARRRPGDPEVAYRLGVCAHAVGDLDGALAAWSRVGPGSAWSVDAGLARARTLVGDFGRFRDGEAVLESLLQATPPGARRDEVRRTLAELDFWEGRRDEILRRIERGWANTSDPVGDLRDHWRADTSPTLLEKVGAEVDRAARRAPDDDRVWLARASLAAQTGRSDEAASWLDRCTKRRPDDPAVWRARLDLARGVDDPAAARLALEHLPADAFAEAERLSIRAWLAARRGDREAERKALEALVAVDPGDTRALDRLATLAAEGGDTSHAREYRRAKAELDVAKDRYRLLMDEPLVPDRFAELAALSERLGRRFEARGWWTLRSAFAPTDAAARRALARLGKPPEPPAASGRNATLADLLADAGLRPGPSGPATASRLAGPVVPRFADDAEAAGLRFVFDNGRSPLRQIPETTAGGVALLDYDGDGRLDVFLVQGGPFPPRPESPNTGDRLFRNKGDSTFEDATERSGIARMPRGFGHGVTVGDVDNDGHPDLFLTRWRAYALYRNKGDGTFEDATDRYGLGGDRDWPTSAAFADLDNDGDLDLYVCHYLKWDADHPTLCKRTTVSAADELSDPGQAYNYCTPRPFPALPDHLFRNDGGTFVDVTAEAGIVDKDGRGLGVVAADVDDDGLVDLFVANDTTANYLWHNLGGLKFEEAGLPCGVSCNADGAFQAGMGTACGDLDGDGRPDLLVTNFYGESTTFFRNLGGGLFADRTASIGLAGPSRYLLGFGIVLFDANNDGHPDLATANGHVNDDRPDYPYAMPALLMVGGEGGRLSDVSGAAGAPWTVPRVARGLACGDLDNDGRRDLLVVAQQGPLAYFHNGTAGGHSLTLRLEGTKSNRDAVGAAVTVEVGEKSYRAWRTGGGSYQSSSDPRLHFGLGDATRVDAVEVRWPSGRIDRYPALEAGRSYHVREGDARPVATP